MKRIYYFFTAFSALLLIVSCKSINYKKTKTGLLYKIFPGKGKDSLLKPEMIVKYNGTFSLNDDSVLYTSYGKAPLYEIIRPEAGSYSLVEILPMMRNGDSAVMVQMTDTLIKKGVQFNFPAKKGDRIVSRIKILQVFASDSLARADYNVEMEKDRPRQMKEQEEKMAKAKEEQRQKQKEEIEGFVKSGEAAKGIKEVQDFLASKNIKAEKTGYGTFVHIDQQGTGPAVETGKYIKVKYDGKNMLTDSSFQANAYAFRIGYDGVVQGWTEGLLLFKQGGKGTLYIPGFLAYANNPGPVGKPFAPLKFDVEVLEVSDTPLAQ